MTVQEKAALFASIVQALGVLVAASSVLFAVYSYIRNRDRDSFSSFRLTLIDLRDTVAALERYLSEDYFSELAHRVVARIRTLLPDDVTKDQLVAYLTDETKHDLLTQEVYIGRFNSVAIERLNDATQTLDRLPYRYREQFPLLFELSRSLLFYINVVGRGATAAKFLETNIAVAEHIKQNIKDGGLFSHPTVSDCFVELEIFACTVAATINRKGEDVFNPAKSLLSIMIDKFSDMTDAQLRSQSRRQRHALRAIVVITRDYKTKAEEVLGYAEAAKGCFKMMQSLFSLNQWDQIVAEETKLQLATTKG